MVHAQIGSFGPGDPFFTVLIDSSLLSQPLPVSPTYKLIGSIPVSPAADLTITPVTFNIVGVAKSRKKIGRCECARQVRQKLGTVAPPVSLEAATGMKLQAFSRKPKTFTSGNENGL